MSLKYRRSILFDQPQQTTAKMALQTLVFDYKQKLKMNSRTNSQVSRGNASPQKLTITQAKYLQGLQSKLKTISFHTLYKQYHRNVGKDQPYNINPQKLEMFRNGKFYRHNQRPRVEQVNQRERGIKKDLMEYYQRHQEQEYAVSKKEIVPVSMRQKRAKTFNSTKKIQL